ncbi:mechanosensitive ion channel family protein [Maritalea sp.]|uniref:mechanosensitive ion channel family protein n=1 Tax=Maritalea sp. TaxID=2003361 RepID=UPI003EF6D76A
METPTTMWISAQDTLETAVPTILGYLPSLLGALIILMVGWIVARFVRAAAKRILSSLNGVLERTFQTGILASVRLPMGASAIFGEATFWVIIFVTLTISARVAQLPTISRWLNDIVIFLPDVLLGVATIGLGYIIGSVVGDQVAEAARSAKSTQSVMLGRVAKAMVFIIAAIIGLNQIGIDVSFLVTISGVAVGTVLLGFSIAFGFGSREYVSNLISARTARQSLSPGHLVRIGGVEGEILEITQTHIALETDKGRALVPAHIAEGSGVLIISYNVTPSEAVAGESI